MSEQRGKLVTCDRCGESIFVKELVATERETDSGFFRWNEYKYEDLPEGWSTVYFGEFVFYTLCPICYELFEKCRNMFFGIEEKDENVVKE